MINQAMSNTSTSSTTPTSKGAHQRPLLEADENATTLGKLMNSGEVQTRRWAGSNQVAEHMPDRQACKHIRRQDMQDLPTDRIRPRLAWVGPLAMVNRLLPLVDTSLLTLSIPHMEHPLCSQV